MAARSEARTHDPEELERVEVAASGPDMPVRSETRMDDLGAHVHAEAPGGGHSTSSRGGANAEPSAAEPVDLESLLGAEVTAAARRTRPATSTPAKKASRSGSRHVPAEVRREVFARDGEQCAYVGPDGDRCPARAYLELDHSRPKAHGGTETAANLRVRCRAHNALYAEQIFSRRHIADRMDLRRRKCAPPIPASFETVARGLQSMGFREPEARRALETLATKPHIEAATVETVLREALLVLT